MTSTRAPGTNPAESSLGEVPDRPLEVGHPSGGECPADQGPQLGVTGRVHLDEHGLDVLGPALKGDAPTGRERRPVVDGGPDVVVARQRPEPPVGVEVRRRLVPQPPVGRIGVFVVLVAEGIEPNHGSDHNGTTRPVRGFRTPRVARGGLPAPGEPPSCSCVARRLPRSRWPAAPAPTPTLGPGTGGGPARRRRGHARHRRAPARACRCCRPRAAPTRRPSLPRPRPARRAPDRAARPRRPARRSSRRDRSS